MLMLMLLLCCCEIFIVLLYRLEAIQAHQYPPNLEYLVFTNNSFFLYNNYKFPSTLKFLKLASKFNSPLTNLPNTLTHLSLGDCFANSLILPPFLTHLGVGKKFEFTTEFYDQMQQLEHLTISDCGTKFRINISLFGKLKVLQIGPVLIKTTGLREISTPKCMCVCSMCMMWVCSKCGMLPACTRVSNISADTDWSYHSKCECDFDDIYDYSPAELITKFESFK